MRVLSGIVHQFPGQRILQTVLQPGVPVLVLTAAMDDGTFIRAVELGARACLWKLSEPEEILGGVRAALGPQPAGDQQGQ